MIISEILESLMGGPLKKTHISYHSKLDSRLTNQYLSLMQSSGLVINTKDAPAFFKITPKGIKFLKIFQNLDELLQTENKDSILNYA